MVLSVIFMYSLLTKWSNTQLMKIKNNDIDEQYGIMNTDYIH